MHKKADEHIWLPFLQFLSNFNETLSISLFFQGRLNRAIKSELTQRFFHSFQGGTKGKKLKLQKKQKKCSQMCSSAFLCISPFNPSKAWKQKGWNKTQKQMIQTKVYKKVVKFSFKRQKIFWVLVFGFMYLVLVDAMD